MIVIDKAALAAARGRPACEACGWRGPVDCAHVFSVGAGEVSTAWNTASICRLCHTKSHAGHSPTTAQLLAIVAKRERLAPADIEAAVQRIRALPKRPTAAEIEHLTHDLTPAARGLVLAAIEKAGA